MQVDSQARSQLAESSRWLIGARITNYAFDDSIPRSKDPAIREIYGQFLWLLYCDLREYRLQGKDAVSELQRSTATRCILFLKSDQPYLWPVLNPLGSFALTLGNLLTLGLAGRIYFRRLSARGDMALWPFNSEAQYTKALRSPKYLAAGAN